MKAPEIYFKAQFLSDSEQLFRKLQTTVLWDQRMKARQTASFGVAYNYSQIIYPQTPMPPELQALCQQLEQTLGFLPNNCLLNYYENGDSTMGFHSDSTAHLAADTGIAIVSLGDVRQIVFRSKSDKTVEFNYALPCGSLLYMSQHIQEHWLHAIPKMPLAKARISLTFRAIVGTD